MPLPRFAVVTASASGRSVECFATYTRPRQASARRPPVSVRPPGSRMPMATSAATAKIDAVTASAAGAPKTATSVPASAGPTMLATT